MRFHNHIAKEVLSMRGDLQKMGIILTTTSPHTLKSNGLYEWINRSLLDEVRCLLRETNMNHKY